MKKILKLIMIFTFAFIITGCNCKSTVEISYKDLEKKLENKESFILEIVQDGCSNCENFAPKFKKILIKNKLTAFSINLSNLSEEDNKKLENLYNITGTPAVIFIEKGEEPNIQRRIVGNVSKTKIISKLKIAGYIK